MASTTYTVCKEGCLFQSIDEAILASKDGDTVEVSSSLIITKQVVINKSIKLIGKNNPILDGQVKSKMLLIMASNVEVAGLTLKNAEISFLDDIAGIRVGPVTDIYIHDNKIHNNPYGIYLGKAKRCRIINNEIIGLGKGDTETGNGIHIWSGKDHIILNNKLSKNRDGIYFEFVTDSKIEGNESFRNARYGLHFMNSHRNEYRNNKFIFNNAGVAVMYSRSVLMENNEFSESNGGGTYGLLLKDITLSKIIHNKFLKNSVGIHMEGVTNSLIKYNYFNDNARAVRIFGNSDGNTFEKNFFHHNSFEVSFSSSFSSNIFTKNYWNKYTGYDLNGDGIGDVPHRPVSLSMILTESINSSFVFIHGPLFFLLDSIENALPSFGPDNLRDNDPLISPPRESL